MSELKSLILTLTDAAEPGYVWVPTDFVQLGNRDAIARRDQLQLLVDGMTVARGLLLGSSPQHASTDAVCFGKSICSGPTI